MAERSRLVIATRNPGKLAEFARLLAAGPWTVLGLDETSFEGSVPEPYDSYAENAKAKASTVCAALGLPTLADDSGLEVDALRGWPGPASARWLGEGRSDQDRLHALLAEVASRSPDDARVRYVCVLALARPHADVVIARGETHGTLVAPAGVAGFGYDPGFLSTELGVTFGQAGDADKDGVSHRGRALRRLAGAGVLGPISE